MYTYLVYGMEIIVCKSFFCIYLDAYGPILSSARSSNYDSKQILLCSDEKFPKTLFKQISYSVEARIMSDFHLLTGISRRQRDAKKARETDMDTILWLFWSNVYIYIPNCHNIHCVCVFCRYCLHCFLIFVCSNCLMIVILFYNYIDAIITEFIYTIFGMTKGHFEM